MSPSHLLPVHHLVHGCAVPCFTILVDGVKMYASTPNANSLVARRGSERRVCLHLRQGVKYIQLVIESWRVFELKKSLV